MSDAKSKLKEARFFMELLEALETRGDSLTTNSSTREEVSFLLSAILNSFYSVTEYLKNVINISEVQNYKKLHPLFYSGKNGLRNITVHERHIEADYIGYIPPVGKVNLVLGLPPKLVSEIKTPGVVTLRLNPRHYVEVNNRMILIKELCMDQYQELYKFVNYCYEKSE
mgnify:FL=1